MREVDVTELEAAMARSVTGNRSAAMTDLLTAGHDASQALPALLCTNDRPDSNSRNT